MSKFTEMGDAVASARKKWSDFRDRCWKDLDSIIKGFVEYCEIPREQVSFSPLDTDPEEGVQYAFAGAVHYAEDGYWHLGLVITLIPFQPLLIELCVNDRDGKVAVKAGRDGKPRTINLQNPTERAAFYDEIVEDVKRYFTEEPDFNDAPSMRKIGFN